MTLKKIIFIASILLQAVSIFAEPHKVNEVIDGRTFLIENNQKVRLTGIDLVEQEKSTKYLNWILNLGWFVDFEFDEVKTDTDGAMMAYVFLVHNPEGVWEILPDVDPLKTEKHILPSPHVNNRIFVNGAIVKAGYAVPSSASSHTKYAALLNELHEFAKVHKIGLWESEQTKGAITIMTQDRACSADSDCIAVQVDCDKINCECGIPINKKFEEKYAQQVKSCRGDVRSIPECEFVCAQGSIQCINGRCEFTSPLVQNE